MKNPLKRLFSRAPETKRTRAFFDAGQYGRRLRAVPQAQASINENIKRYGATILTRSRWLTANNPYAAAAKEAFITAFVGTGIKPSSKIKDKALKARVQQLWTDWTDASDADNLTDFYGQQAIIAGEIFEAGECFVRLRARREEDELPVPFQLQILPAEMLDLNFNEKVSDSVHIECGIEFGPIGNRIAYHFWREHPQGSAVSRTSERVRIPASEVLHLYKPRQAGQIRGIPHTLPAIVRTAIFDLYDDAELERKKTAALFVGAISREMPTVDEDHPLENILPSTVMNPSTDPGYAGVLPAVPTGASAGLEPGALLDLGFGETITFSEPADVGATYEAFQLRNLLAIAAGYGVPYSSMTGDLRQTNYSSIRAGLVEFRRKVEMMQHQILVFQLCRPVWVRFWNEAVMSGAIEGVSPSRFKTEQLELVRAKWIPPKFDWVDPLKDRQAERLAVRAGFKTLSDVVEAEGYDAEEVFEEIAAERKRLETLGVIFDSDAAFTSSAGVGQPSGSAPLDDEPEEVVEEEELEEEPEEEVVEEEEDVELPVTRAELQDMLRDERASLMAEIRDTIALTREAPPSNTEVHMHQSTRGRTKTTVTKWDEKGRIIEAVNEPVEEDAE